MKLERNLALDSLRATIQLILVGFILEFILRIGRLDALILILLFMCAVASAVASKEGRKIPRVYGASFVGIITGSSITFIILYSVGIIPPEARYIIPLGGMIVGNAMKAVSLALNHLVGELENKRGRIETLLALGAGPRQACAEPLQESVRSAMIPTIAMLKTVGLVHLPGIMTGFIIAGGSPVLAVKYQLVVIYMIVGTTGVACLITTLIAYRQCFNKDLQLLRCFGTQ